jgi:hypothetical protein
MKKTLIDYQSIDRLDYYSLDIVKPSWKIRILKRVDKILRSRNFTITKLKPVIKEKRLLGEDWPARAFTMIGNQRLDNIEYCVKEIIINKIEGDFIETGVWRGGAVIFMKAILRELKIENRNIWLADSFEGVPKPNSKYPEDLNCDLYQEPILKVSKQEVLRNFELFDLLDERIKVLEGWFHDTLPNNPIKKLSLIRLDGDLYESTIIALENLYPKLSIGGYIIVDDYHAFPFCKKAVDDYRRKNDIKDVIQKIDREAIFWRKEK